MNNSHITRHDTADINTHKTLQHNTLRHNSIDRACYRHLFRFIFLRALFFHCFKFFFWWEKVKKTVNCLHLNLKEHGRMFLFRICRTAGHEQHDTRHDTVTTQRNTTYSIGYYRRTIINTVHLPTYLETRIGRC